LTRSSFSLSFFASFFLSLCGFCEFVDNPKSGVYLTLTCPRQHLT
jgi:hypothetical protein